MDYNTNYDNNQLSIDCINHCFPFSFQPQFHTFSRDHSDKEYLSLLPLCKWSDDTVRGKILSDIICSIVRNTMQKIVNGSTLRSMTELIGCCQSLMCFNNVKSGKIYVETPNRQVKECYKAFGVTPPVSFDLKEYLGGVVGI